MEVSGFSDNALSERPLPRWMFLRHYTRCSVQFTSRSPPPHQELGFRTRVNWQISCTCPDEFTSSLQQNAYNFESEIGTRGIRVKSIGKYIINNSPLN